MTADWIDEPYSEEECEQFDRMDWFGKGTRVTEGSKQHVSASKGVEAIRSYRYTKDHCETLDVLEKRKEYPQWPI